MFMVWLTFSRNCPHTNKRYIRIHYKAIPFMHVTIYWTHIIIAVAFSPQSSWTLTHYPDHFGPVSFLYPQPSHLASPARSLDPWPLKWGYVKTHRFNKTLSHKKTKFSFLLGLQKNGGHDIFHPVCRAGQTRLHAWQSYPYSPPRTLLLQNLESLSQIPRVW